MKTKKIWIFVWLISLLITFVMTFVNNRPYLLMGGSSSVAPLMEELIGKYPDNHKAVDFNYISSASSGALPRVESKLFGVGWLSKTYPSPSKTIFSFQMMLDGLVIVYNLPKSAFKNPNHIETLNFTAEKVQDLYIKNETWSQVFPDKIIANKKAQTYTRPNGSGTRDVFDQLVLNSPQKPYNANTVESSSAMLALDQWGIGYSSLADILQAKTLAVSKGKWDGKDATIPEIEKHHYTLVRPFTGLININYPDPKPIAAMLNWIFSNASNPIFEKYGPRVERNEAINQELDKWLDDNGYPNPNPKTKAI